MEQMRERVIEAIREIDAECQIDEYGTEYLNGETDLSEWECEVIADAALYLMQPEIDRRVAEEKAKLLERLRDDLNMAIDLIQEAKGWEGPRGGPVTDRLDAAEMWIDGALAQFEKEQQRWQMI